MIDAYIWGKVERISPEAPVPILSKSKKENRLGGAANVALNIQSLGATPILCSVIGNDAKATIFMDLLQNLNMPQNGIIKEDTRITTVKTRVIADKQHLIRVDEEDDSAINYKLETRFSEHIHQIIEKEKVDAIIFEDYDKGIITKKIIENTVDIAIKKNIPTLVDPKKRNFLSYNNVTVFKPNFKEFSEGLSLHIEKNNIEALQNSATYFRERFDIKHLLLTLSEYGIFIASPKESHLLPTNVREVTDVSGAGDTVISVASLCLASGCTPLQMAAIANLAGGIVCERVGVVPVDKNRLLEEAIIFFEKNKF
jgi:rfaE bifunctional protein kinase chain/domain